MYEKDRFKTLSKVRNITYNLPISTDNQVQYCLMKLLSNFVTLLCNPRTLTEGFIRMNYMQRDILFIINVTIPSKLSH